jgi:hypothetical protein
MYEENVLHLTAKTIDQPQNLFLPELREPIRLAGLIG